MSNTIETVAGQVADHPDAVTAAVQQSHSAAAPTSALEVTVAQHGSVIDTLVDKVTEIQNTVAAAQPLIDASESIIAATVPGAAPVINRVSAIESFLGDLMTTLKNHLPKLELPAPPAPPA